MNPASWPTVRNSDSSNPYEVPLQFAQDTRWTHYWEAGQNLPYRQQQKTPAFRPGLSVAISSKDYLINSIFFTAENAFVGSLTLTASRRQKYMPLAKFDAFHESCLYPASCTPPASVWATRPTRS